MTVLPFPTGGRDAHGAGPGRSGEPEVFDITGDLPTPGRTTLLEASAGTGKTWTIAALVTRLVAEGHGRLEEMLVVTFGRAASQELRERVRAQLVDAERSLDACVRGTPPDDPDALVALLCTPDPADPAELGRRLERLRLALTDFDAATIATTHQFCQLVLRSLGVAGDTDAGSRLVENLDDLLVEVVDDLYVRGFARSDDAPVFSRADALAIARVANGDPQAHLVEPPPPEDGAAATPAYRRWRFARAVREEMDLRKRRLGVLSYDDLLSRLAAALEDEQAPARQRMRDRWRFVLVDEFQDTDPVQWQVLDRAFSGVATMVLIGDPKQAIYAFRGGDVVTYLAAEETAGVKATLGTNHRSDQPLLDAVQTLLRGAALGDGRIVVRDVDAAHTGRRLAGAPRPEPFRLRVVDRERFGVKGTKGVPIGELRTLVAEDLAADVRALLTAGATYDDRSLVAGDVAVLCETRRQCEIARSALVAAGVQAVIAGSGSVYATEGADEWVCLLEALDAPHRSERVRAAALTSFFGHTAAELDAEGDALTERVSDVLRSWGDLLRLRGVAAVFETAVAAHDVPARVLAREGGERLLTDLRHVAESLHDESTRERLGLTALLAWMRGRMTEARSDVTGERTRRLDSDAAAVQILTIHGSKGLQFPVVYLPFASDLFPRVPDHPLFHDEAGRRCLDVSGPGSPYAAAAVGEEAGEDLRLLYVALTRAQSQVVTWWLPSAKNTRNAPLHRMLFGRLPGGVDVPREAPVHPDDRAREIARHWQDAGGAHVEPVEVAADTGPVPGDDLGDLRARSWTRRVDPDWRRTSYTALSSAAARSSAGPDAARADQVVVALGSEPEHPLRDDEPDAPVPAAADIATATATDAEVTGTAAGVRSPMADLPVGATFGSLVHAVLEHTDPAALEHGGDLRAALLEQVRTQLVRWPVALDAEVLADALVAVHDTPLGPLVGDATLRGIGVRNRMSELDFELPLAGGDVAGRRERARLSDLGPLLRAHLAAGDPLLPYADTLDDEGHAAQVLAGYLTGSVDVVLRVPVDGAERFVIVDYKSNWLGAPDEELTAEHYRPAALAEAMTHSSYPLQALLYAVVLHRFLRWRLAGYDPETHLGGVMYLYLRGLCGLDTPVVAGERCGVFSWRPPVALVEAVSDLLDGKERS
ncbi:UvrD-helicase domain-containing protein [Nocardioides sp. HDW12B]|uniref:UvrD-helicase domain-containing protein n=1 Tax=Nocardioides sp. HDW12B TaxID=2714939 RepID=UPI00140E16C4|nr:UvrD-helicase domain-containing protein [Nocardioides sp. HDW12B]QIK67871.1 UvrD-helicase domain-containing protein [Nocardioides sp. HDW12B]